MPDVILDGSYLEGGGQIIRTALALSCLTGKSFSIDKIRQGRSKPGLKAQHLFCVKAAAHLTRAEFTDIELGSTSIAFFPNKISAKAMDIDIGTAGSITLFLQSVLIPSMFANAPVRISITGGTDVAWSMPIDYLREILFPHIKEFADIEIRLMKRGYYPKGGGKVELLARPIFKISDFENFNELFEYMRSQKIGIEKTYAGNLIQVRGISHASKNLSEANVAERQTEMARMSLKELKCPVNIDTQYADTLSSGSGITLWARSDSGAIIGADSLGEKGKPSEKVGKEAAEKLGEEVQKSAPIDSHLADNLIPFLGLFGGKIKVTEITGHTLTNIYVTEKFLDVKFEVDKEKNMIYV